MLFVPESRSRQSQESCRPASLRLVGSVTSSACMLATADQGCPGRICGVTWELVCCSIARRCEPCLSQHLLPAVLCAVG